MFSSNRVINNLRDKNSELEQKLVEMKEKWKLDSKQGSDYRKKLESIKTIEMIRKQCLDEKMATGVIQNALMELGMTLEEADVLINYWYKDLPDSWFLGVGE
ncbi:MAG: hypothetical protein ACTSRU_12720 [Candidatus Hodarchaeales archaeon]